MSFSSRNVPQGDLQKTFVNNKGEDAYLRLATAATAEIDASHSGAACVAVPGKE